jgi:hypothetical protein
MASMPDKDIAFKEWAVAVQALEQGSQIILLRKGGIHEEAREFQLTEEKFYFYPNAFHQKKELIKPEYHEALERTLTGVSPEDPTVTVSSFAEVTDDIEIMDEEILKKLSPYHIFTDEMVTDRLHWKKTKPLHVLILRTYVLDKPIEIHKKPEFQGCKSWISLHEEIGKQSFKPALSDEKFQRLRQEILDLIQQS